MSGVDPNIDRSGATIAANAVREQQRLLAAEFGPQPDDARGLPEPNGPFERMLCEVLISIGWQGEQHQILEALPHLEPIMSTTMLRTVLARLDVRLIPIERSAADLSAAGDLPCLLVGEEADCRLLTAGPQGDLEAYDLHSGTRSKADPRGLRGKVYLIRRNEPDHIPDGQPGAGFVGYVLKQLRRPLVRIAGYSAAINLLGLGLSVYILLVYDTVIATSSLDTLAFLASAALLALALDLRLRQARSKTIAYLAGRVDAVVSLQTLGAVLNL